MLAAALLPVLATAAAYLNSFNGPFIFDDIESIPHNRTIRQMDTALSPPNAEGITVQGRPILNLSLAVNYALGGTDVWGYHVFNLAIHVLAALALFGIVRRTLLLPSMRDRFGPAAPYLAGAVAMLWALHPLQTESVTYVVQRAESLMGLFYLATLYCAIRSSLSGAALWSLAAVAACALGMATKEVMVTAPVIVLLYDRTFLSGSFREAIRKRWGLYAALTACWAVLVCLMVHAGNRGGTAGFGAGDVLDGWSYARTQCWAILKYLLLTLWPDGLCLDYGSSIRATLWQIVPGALVAGAVALATIVGLRRGRKWGFLGACFLAILAPTSSIVPLRDPIFEHRMYLPLAAVLAAVVMGAFWLWKRLPHRTSGSSDTLPAWRWVVPSIVLTAVTSSLASLTLLRNHDYRSPLAIWEDTVNKAPENPWAHRGLGFILAGEPGELPRAVEQYRQAVRLQPTYAVARYELGRALILQRKIDEAIGQFREAIRLKPEFAEAHDNLGAALFNQGKSENNQGKIEEAMEHYNQAIRLNPLMPEAYMNLAIALKRAGRDEEAIQALNKAKALESSRTSP